MYLPAVEEDTVRVVLDFAVEARYDVAQHVVHQALVGHRLSVFLREPSLPHRVRPGGRKGTCGHREGLGTEPEGRKGTCRGRRGIRDWARGVQMNLKRTWRD